LTSSEDVVSQLQKVVCRLPLTNFVAAAQLMRHLHRYVVVVVAAAAVIVVVVVVCRRCSRCN